MLTLNEFKNDLNEAIEGFSKKEGVIMPTTAKDIVDIKKIMSDADSLTLLKQQLTEKCNTMTIKRFSFLPFVNDLRKELLRVIHRPKYDLINLLVSECRDLRMENRKLNQENQNLNVNSAVF